MFGTELVKTQHNCSALSWRHLSINSFQTLRSSSWRNYSPLFRFRFRFRRWVQQRFPARSSSLTRFVRKLLHEHVCKSHFFNRSKKLGHFINGYKKWPYVKLLSFHELKLFEPDVIRNRRELGSGSKTSLKLKEKMGSNKHCEELENSGHFVALSRTNRKWVIFRDRDSNKLNEGWLHYYLGDSRILETKFVQ